MDLLRMENVGFKYVGSSSPVLEDISFKVKRGDFLVVIGSSGSGKSTLLRLLKRELVTNGETSGKIYFEDRLISDLSDQEAASKIGYVMQDPEAQIVTDKVWSELAFGLENIGVPRDVIRSRIGEMANYFGIHNWYQKDVADLSGGQKQLLNLASILVMQPEIVVLDEPTAQLDPIASLDFLRTLQRINTELNTTIIMAEHYLEEVFGMADNIMIINEGTTELYSSPLEAANLLLKDEKRAESLPSPIRLHYLFENKEKIPFTISDGIQMMTSQFGHQEIVKQPVEQKSNDKPKKTIISLKHVSFKYGRLESDILHDVTLDIYEGEIFSILGGNGAGKSTLMKVMSGLALPYQGKVSINGKKVKPKSNHLVYGHEVVYLPQQPLSMFVKESVKADYESFLKTMGYTNIEESINGIADWFNISHLLEQHPYDLSGGELQLVALGKILLLDPDIIFLDEPTKGVDTQNKNKIAHLLKEFSDKGKTVIIVTHDVDFSAKLSSRCGLFFDRQMISISDPVTFFSNNYFYTTPINKMVKSYFPKVVTFDQAKESWQVIKKREDCNE
ncbi:energy-coupling factor transporter ATPase [Vagococcus carniphilus]|uniref:ABC transporter ATP-binding protein n=1 Tax=Vagococcus carniphilus TaxID=218144 RepID=UPI002891858F|nr:energy-coupling factor transporter ATPase [Vagococcus carniphilus]MDT2829377.1 energy-coupling factor transporter ATPase [Vagococcus carniphilus]MDT2838836.1 energy-coupling factor transporter ATPase [Vagococcus carniphilus]MDT2852894.1 energy-coupling factor transporter ATPase [Vagococcus carniphilus]